MTELRKDERKQAIASIQQYAERNLSEPLGELAAGLLLDFFVQEIGPLIYNKAVSDAQTRLQDRIAEIDGELHEPAFTYWLKAAGRRR